MDVSAVVQKIKQLLGSSDRKLCIHDECDYNFVFSNNGRGILSTVQSQHPVVQLVSDMVESQHNKYGSGGKTLVVLFGLWSQHRDELLRRGVPVSNLLAEYDRVMENLPGILDDLACEVDSESHERPLETDNPGSDEDGLVEGRLSNSSTQAAAEDKFEEASTAENDSDISWFFDGGKLLPRPYLNNIISGLIPPTIDQDTNSKSNFSGTDASASPNNSHNWARVDCRGVTESDEEFGSCFDNIRFNENDTRSKFVSESKFEDNDPSISICDSQEHCSLESYSNSSQSCSQATLDNILKAKCDEIKKQSINRSRHFRTVDTSVEEMKSRDCAIEILNSSQGTSQVTDSRRTTAVQDPMYSQSTMENRMNQILAEKQQDTNFRVLTQSRHFKTIQNSVENMQRKQYLTGHEDVFVSTEPKSISVEKYKELRLKDKLQGKVTVTICEILDSFKIKAPQIYPLLHEAYESRRCGHRKEFLTDQLHSICLGKTSWNNSCVVQGLLLKAPSDMLPTIIRNDGFRNVLLVNGDVSPHFSHTGSKTIQKKCEVGYFVKTVSDEDRWRAEVIESLVEVTVVFAKGVVDEILQDACLSKNIILFALVPSRVLLAIGEVCQIPLSVYVEDCTEDDTGSGVYLKKWNLKPERNTQELDYIVVEVEGAMFQTIVVCHPSEAEAVMREELFWKCAHGLEQITCTGVVLRGAGQTERLCAERLAERASEIDDTEINNDEAYKKLVWISIASGLHEFATTLSCKEIPGSDTNILCCDDLPSKLAAWKGALQLLKLFTHLHFEITTRYPQENDTTIFGSKDTVGQM